MYVWSAVTDVVRVVRYTESHGTAGISTLVYEIGARTGGLLDIHYRGTD